MQEQNFEEVIEANKDKIYRICKTYAVTPIEPQDLFQEVVFQIWKSFANFKAESKVDTWVYRIALNVCMRSKLNFERNKDKMMRLDAIEYKVAIEEPEHLEKERYQFLKECIASLNEADTSIIILYLEDLSFKEIAKITGLTENHVAVKMKRIRKRLFDCITPKMN